MAEEKPCFTPVGHTFVRTVADAAGLDLSRCVDFALEFPEPALVVAVVKYHIPPDDFARVVEAIGAIPKKG